jgi:hypothetical protein
MDDLQLRLDLDLDFESNAHVVKYRPEGKRRRSTRCAALNPATDGTGFATAPVQNVSDITAGGQAREHIETVQGVGFTAAVPPHQ